MIALKNLIFILLIFPVFALAQYKPMPVDNVKWSVSTPSGFGGYTQTYFTTNPINRDTLISGKTYAKLYDHYCLVYGGGSYCYLGAYRSDTTGKSIPQGND